MLTGLPFIVSATWPESVRRLASTFLTKPVHITVGSDELTANKRITQGTAFVERSHFCTECCLPMTCSRRSIREHERKGVSGGCSSLYVMTTDRSMHVSEDDFSATCETFSRRSPRTLRSPLESSSSPCTRRRHRVWNRPSSVPGTRSQVSTAILDKTRESGR